MARLTREVAREWWSYEPRGLLSPLVVAPLWLAVTVAFNELEQARGCTPVAPCTGEVAGAAFAAAWVTALAASFLAPRVAAVCAAASGTVMALNVAAPAGVRVVAAASAAWVTAVAGRGVRARAARRAYVASVAESVPRPFDRRLERRARGLLAGAVLTASLAVAAGVVSAEVVERERARERAALVADAVVTRHEPGGYVVFRAEDRESAWEAYDPDEYPVGAVVPVYVLDSGARPVAEPYDAAYAAFPALLVCGAALVLAERALVAQGLVRRAAVPALEASAYGSRRAVTVTADERAVLLVHGTLGDEPREVVVAGDLVPGGWAAVLDGGRVVTSGRVYGAGRARDAVREALRRG
ncbi:MAG TPA: hypothetical protein VGX28_16270 [Frankiaceae bacterium]|nr:hypothetical protein [Frankiaceae bacterium]